MGRLKLKKKPNGLTGETPMEPRIWIEFQLEKRPSDQWMADHQTEINEGKAPDPTDADMVAGINMYGFMAMPSRTVPVRLWKRGRQLIGTLHEIEYAQFKAACEADIADQLAGAPGNHRLELGEVAAAALASHAGQTSERLTIEDGAIGANAEIPPEVV